jgi:hypothetical protein
MSVTTFPLRECKGNVPENILTVSNNPRDKIFNNPFLAPSPLFTAFTTLQAVLGWRQVSSPWYYVLKYLIDIISLILHLGCSFTVFLIVHTRDEPYNYQVDIVGMQYFISWNGKL